MNYLFSSSIERMNRHHRTTYLDILTVKHATSLYRFSHPIHHSKVKCICRFIPPLFFSLLNWLCKFVSSDKLSVQRIRRLRSIFAEARRAIGRRTPINNVLSSQIGLWLVNQHAHEGGQSYSSTGGRFRTAMLANERILEFWCHCGGSSTTQRHRRTEAFANQLPFGRRVKNLLEKQSVSFPDVILIELDSHRKRRVYLFPMI